MDLQEIITALKQIAAECEKVTSGNVSHRIANIEHGILNLADHLEKYCSLGWYPASKPPREKDVEVVMLVDVPSPQFTGSHPIRVPILGKYINGWPKDINVKLWCYPPEVK